MSRVGKHQPDLGSIAGADSDRLAEVTFPSRCFFCEDVTGKRLMAPDLARPADFEALCSASVCFKFHFKLLLSFLPRSFSSAKKSRSDSGLPFWPWLPRCRTRPIP